MGDVEALTDADATALWEAIGAQSASLRTTQAVGQIIAAHVAAARAEAWDEGHRLTAPHSDRCEPTCPNPYREDLRPREGA